MPQWTSLPNVDIHTDVQVFRGPLEPWRHTLGHGGINSLPLPDKVVEGAAALKPRLIRIFLQEFFNIYPRHGRFDWSRLDPYMASFARIGAKIVAAICIKPRPLFPKVDQAVWRPNDVKEWQHVIAQLVQRYSIDQPIVTHWEIGNEVDIGEEGGCPYLIRDPREYGEYYSMTIEPILRIFPQAKVGGPAMADLLSEPLPGFLKYCKQTGAQLDFISWHLYHSDPNFHAGLVRTADLLCRELLGRRPEFMVTECNRRLGPSTEDQAYDPRRAAAIAAIILDMRSAGLDWSFHYHLWDQTCFAEEFAPFFSDKGVANMIRHWNETPHRLGLFGVDGNVRPQYFVYRIFAQMGENEIAAASSDRDIRVLSTRSADQIHCLAVNYSLDEPGDRIATFRFAGLTPGLKELTIWRLDREQRWSSDTLEMTPIEQRRTYALRDFLCQAYLPADSALLLSLRPAD